MNRFKKIFAVLLCLALTASFAEAETWQSTVENPVHPISIEIDLGVDNCTITKVNLQIAGSYIPAVYHCTEMDQSSTTFYSSCCFVGSFNQASPADSSGWPGVGGPSDSDPFEINHDYDVSDPTEWAFLVGNPGLFNLRIYSFQPDLGPRCSGSSISHLTLNSVTLTIEYTELVPNEATSWTALKALYR